MMNVKNFQIKKLLWLIGFIWMAGNLQQTVLAQNYTGNGTKYSLNSFDAITLKEDIPSTFYKNEVYFFEGDITQKSKSAFVFLAPMGTRDEKKYLKYGGEVLNRHFKIPVHFETPGHYRLGIIPNSTGESKVVEITVKDELPLSSKAISPKKAASPSIYYKNFVTTVKWGKKEKSLVKLSFKQNTSEKIFFFRQNENNFVVPYKAFENFKSGPVVMSLEVADRDEEMKTLSPWSEKSIMNFMAAQHWLTIHNTESINIKIPEETYKNISRLSFSGITKTIISNEALIINPDGNIESVKLKTDEKKVKNSIFISKNSPFHFEYFPKKAGPYTVEINDEQGESVLTAAFYVKEGIPLIPNFFDKNSSAENEKIKDKSLLRNQILKLINQERAKQGIKPVSNDVLLQKLAQAHSDDMAKNEFFSHINKKNLSPDERRKALKVITPVGENLANSPNLLFAHEGLMQSAAHRKNLLDPAWTKVGIGIAFDKKGMILVTEEFSNDPPTMEQIKSFEREIINATNKKREDEKIKLLLTEETLQILAKDWTALMTQKKFFDFTSPEGIRFEKKIRDALPGKSVKAVILEANNKDQLLKKILLEKNTYLNNWTKIGLSVGVSQDGQFLVTILYTGK